MPALDALAETAARETPLPSSRQIASHAVVADAARECRGRRRSRHRDRREADRRARRSSPRCPRSRSGPNTSSARARGVTPLQHARERQRRLDGEAHLPAMAPLALGDRRFDARKRRCRERAAHAAVVGREMAEEAASVCRPSCRRRSRSPAPGRAAAAEAAAAARESAACRRAAAAPAAAAPAAAGRRSSRRRGAGPPPIADDRSSR